MTISASVALFISMAILAVIPGPGVIAVVARSTSSGLSHGMTTSLGIVSGDYIFIVLALLGLSTLSSVLGGLFLFVKYLGAAYLIWLGVALFLPSKKMLTSNNSPSKSYLSSYLVGLATTLGNPKAILFYLSFFPAFLNLEGLAILDVVWIFVITTASIGGVMIFYAYISVSIRSNFSNSTSNPFLKYGAGSMLIGSGVYVAARS